MAVSPIGSVRRVLDYGVTAIEPSKIYMGMPNYGYDWPLPFERGVTRAPVDRECGGGRYCRPVWGRHLV